MFLYSEKQKHLLTIVLASVLGGVAGSVATQLSVGTVAAASDAAESITAKEIRLVDEEGRCRAALAVRDDNAVVLLFSTSDLIADGKLRTDRMSAPDEIMVFGLAPPAWNSKSPSRPIWDVAPGSDTFSRPSGYWQSSSSSVFQLVDPWTTVNDAQLGWHDKQPALKMWDGERGGVRTLLSADKEGEPFLTFMDRQERTRIQLGLGYGGEPNLIFFDADGKPTWAARE